MKLVRATVYLNRKVWKELQIHSKEINNGSSASSITRRLQEEYLEEIEKSKI